MTRKTGLQRRQNRSAAWKRFSPLQDPGKDTLQPAELPAGCRVLQGSQLCATGSHARVDLVTGLHFQACSVCSKGPLTIIPSMPFQPFIGRSPPNAFEKRICFFLLFFLCILLAGLCEGVRVPGGRVTGSCQLSWGCWESNPDPLEQPALFSAPGI